MGIRAAAGIGGGREAVAGGPAATRLPLAGSQEPSEASV